MLLRERLRPYLHEQLDLAAGDGLPAMRPLFFDFPDDAEAWAVDDQFMLGPDILVAPVMEPGTAAASTSTCLRATGLDA